MLHQRIKLALSRPLSAAIAGLVLAGLAACGANPAAAPSADSLPTVAKNDKLAEQVPTRYARDGVLKVATDPSYAPMEFAQDGRYRGVDIEVAREIGAILGLRVEFAKQAFSTIVPAIAIGRYELGISALWADGPEAGLVDMISYYESRILFAVRTTGPAPKSLGLGLCGYSVMVEEGTELVDMLVKTAAGCRQTGRLPLRVETVDDQAIAITALKAGKVDTIVADSPVITYAVAQSNGQLAPLGPATSPRPYGIAAARTYPQWAGIIQSAVQELISGGQYAQILATWNASEGAIQRAMIYSSHPVTDQPGGNVAPSIRSD